MAVRSGEEEEAALTCPPVRCCETTQQAASFDAVRRPLSHQGRVSTSDVTQGILHVTTCRAESLWRLTPIPTDRLRPRMSRVNGHILLHHSRTCNPFPCKQMINSTRSTVFLLPKNAKTKLNKQNVDALRSANDSRNAKAETFHHENRL
ncbi:hypothetical protein T07_706 [Trichinella nelsoni]|uniref:Uncharacterized protein n=1 Tax=Trichinella nelsoni TaxID=6336 RepID=A0A0V0SK28_9BILA|nr:hypothetical protein T07_706 [Trichinella nelsoni]